jgi:hypothetical protein
VQLGAISAALGDLERAREQAGEGRALASAIGEQSTVAHALQLEASLLRKAGKLDDSLHSLDEAARLYRQVGDDPAVERAKLDGAERALAAGNATAAEGLAGEALTALQPRPGDADALSYGHDLLARALLAQHKIKAARVEADRALAVLVPEPRFDLRLGIELTLARLESAEGHPANMVKKRIARVLAESKRTHCRELELSARLVQLELTPGRKSASAAHALQAEATRLGFRLLAKQAAAVVD